MKTDLDITFQDLIKQGWIETKKKIWFVISVILVVYLIEYAIGYISKEVEGHGLLPLFVSLASLMVSTVLNTGLLSIFFALSLDKQVDITDLWSAGDKFWKFLGVTFFYIIIVVAGFILLIVPGFIWAMTYQFAFFLVIDKGMSPVLAMKKSKEITYGHRKKLFFLWLGFVIFNLLGTLA